MSNKVDWKPPVVIDSSTRMLVEISTYKRLQERDTWLSFLEAAGVDNWQGIDVAIDMMNEANG